MFVIKKILGRIISTISPMLYAKFIGVKIGKGCFIGTTYWPSETYLISIGNNVAITSGVKIFTHGGGRVARQLIPEFDCFGKVTIEDWAYIGTNALIMPGVTIGKGSLVAAGAVVVKSVPPGYVVGGNPAKVICPVSEYIKRNLKYNVNSKSMSYNEKKKYLLNKNIFISKGYYNINQ